MANGDNFSLMEGMDSFNPSEFQAPQMPETPPMPDIYGGQPELPEIEAPQDINSSIDNLINNFDFNGQEDPFATNKTLYGDFRNPNMQNQLFERYASHADFDELGFNPLRNNEELYNEHSSLFDEIGRSWGSFTTLAGLGLKDAASFGSRTDIDMAKEFERAMAVGSSTKGGATGFATNLFLNSGYTFGIMAELALEEGALALAEAGLVALTAGTGGAASPLTGPAMGVTASLMATRAAKAFGKIGTAWKTMGNVAKSLDALKDFGKAKSYFGNAVKGTAQFLNPLENTTDYLGALYKSGKKLGPGYDAFKGLNNITKTAKGAAEFYRDVRNIRLAWGEAGLEGGMVTNQMQHDLLKEFKSEHGRMPNEEEATKIKQTSLMAGADTHLWNALAISASNKIVFDGLIGAGKFKNLGNRVFKSEAGKVLFNSKNTDQAYKAIDGLIRESIKTADPALFFKGVGVSAAKGLGRYSAANFAEGLQESAQESIAFASEQYHKALYDGNPIAGGFLDSIYSGIANQASAQGLETFASGFLMGGIVAPIATVAGKAKEGLYSTVSGKKDTNNLKLYYDHLSGKQDTEIKDEEGNVIETTSEWDSIKKKRRKILDERVEKLNEAYKDPKKFFSPIFQNLIHQGESGKALSKAIASKDSKTFYDVIDSQHFGHAVTALEMGHYDTLIQRLEEQLTIEPEDVKKTYGLEFEEYQKQLQNGIDQAKQVKERWDYFNDKYENPFNINDQPEKHIGWQKAVRQASLMGYSFDRALKRQQSVLNNAKDISGLKDTSTSEFNALLDATQEIINLEEEVKVMGMASKEGMTAETKKDYREKSKKLETLQRFDKLADELIDETDSAKKEKKYKSLKSTFNKYIKLISKDKFQDTDALDKTLESILDYKRLEVDAKNMNGAVNMLLDPQQFLATVDRQIEMVEGLRKNQKDLIKRSYDEFIKIDDMNELLKALGKLGVFINPADVPALKEGKIPSRFYYTPDNANPNTTEEVKKNSEDFDNAAEAVKEYIVRNLESVDPTNINIKNAKEDVYKIKSRSKTDNDERTYNNLAEQFGFNAKESKSKVLSKIVLQAIIDSDFASPREKAYAKEELKITKDDEYITFSKESTTPGEYNFSDREITIDARFASHEYAQGQKGNPLEHVILHEIVKKRTADQLELNEEFRGKMEALQNEAKKAYETADIPIQFKGLTDLNEFVAEAMSNETFQNFLGTVDLKESMQTRSTGWQAFVDLVLESVLKALGQGSNSTANGTVLNATLDIITTNIKEVYGEEITSEAPKTVAESQGPVSRKSRASTIRNNHPQLYKDLIEDFKDLNAKDTVSGKFKLALIENMDAKEIGNTDEFRNYLDEVSLPSRDKIFKEYNKDKEPVKIKPAAAPVKSDVSDVEDKKANIDNINSKIEEIVNRGEAKKEYKPVTKEDRKNKVDFDLLFSDISKALSGETKSEIKNANKLLKQYLKEVHPDKIQDENKKLIAESFATAMIEVAKKGNIAKLEELYNLYKETQVELAVVEQPTEQIDQSKPTGVIEDIFEKPVIHTVQRSSGAEPKLMTSTKDFLHDELEYTNPQISEILAAEGAEYLNKLAERGIAYEEYNEWASSMKDIISEREDPSVNQTKVQAEFYNILNSIKDQKTLEEAQESLKELLLNNASTFDELGFNEKFITEKIEKRRQEVIKNFNFEDIESNTWVFLNPDISQKGESQIGYVESITDKSIKITPKGSKRTITVSKDNFKDSIMMPYSDLIEEKDVKGDKEVTPEEVDLSNESLDENVEAAEIDKTVSKVKQNGTQLNWLDNINNCK